MLKNAKGTNKQRAHMDNTKGGRENHGKTMENMWENYVCNFILGRF